NEAGGVRVRLAGQVRTEQKNREAQKMLPWRRVRGALPYTGPCEIVCRLGQAADEVRLVRHRHVAPPFDLEPFHIGGGIERQRFPRHVEIIELHRPGHRQNSAAMKMAIITNASPTFTTVPM